MFEEWTEAYRAWNRDSVFAVRCAPCGSSMRPVSLAVFKTVVPHLRDAEGGFDSHGLPPHNRTLQHSPGEWMKVFLMALHRCPGRLP